MDQQPTQPEQQVQPQEPPIPSPSSSRLPSFLRKKPTNVQLAIIIVAAVVGIGMLVFIFVAPARKTIVQTANNLPFIPQAIPTSVPEATIEPIITPSPTLVPTATIVPTPTATTISWKNYINSIYGYSIKYPSDWVAQDLGALEPQIPSYIVFNPPTASASARYITVSISTRSYDEQLTYGASASAVTVAGIKGTRQYFQDSDGHISTAIILPRTDNLLIIRAKTAYLTIFEQMITTLKTTQ